MLSRITEGANYARDRIREATSRAEGARAAAEAAGLDASTAALAAARASTRPSDVVDSGAASEERDALETLNGLSRIGMLWSGGDGPNRTFRPVSEPDWKGA